MHVQEVKKVTLSSFDDKRYYINETESKPWEKIYNIFVMMLNYLYYLIVVFHENYLYEFVISSDSCYEIYLLLNYHKHDNKFYTHHHRHSIIFL